MVKAWIAVLVILLVVLIGYPLVFPSTNALTENQAKEYVLEDLRPVTSQGTEVRFVDARRNDGQWSIDVLLTRDGHGPCPKVDKRFYTVFPIGFRAESVVATCNEKVDINYREEALIQSAKKISVASGAYGCAFFGKEYKSADARAYCAYLEEAGLDSFSQDVPSDAWLVQWSGGLFVALSKSGQVLKTG